MSISLVLFSPPTQPPLLFPSSPSKPYLTLKPHLSLRPSKFLTTTKASAENGAGTSPSAATALEIQPDQKVAETPQQVVQKDERSVGANGSAGAVETEEDKVLSQFVDPKWVGGTWDLSQFRKDGNTDWDAVIDAGEVLGS